MPTLKLKHADTGTKRIGSSPCTAVLAVADSLLLSRSLPEIRPKRIIPVLLPLEGRLTAGPVLHAVQPLWLLRKQFTNDTSQL